MPGKGFRPHVLAPSYFEVQRTRMRDSSVSPSARCLWAIIQTYANMDGYKAFPAAETLMKHMGVSKNTIFKLLKELRKANWIFTKQRIIKGQFNSNDYVLIEPLRIPKSGTRPHTTFCDTTVPNSTVQKENPHSTVSEEPPQYGQFKVVV